PLNKHIDTVIGLAFSPDGKILASSSRDNSIILWDVQTHQSIAQPFTGHKGIIWSVAFSPDGKTLASTSDDKTIILWDVDPSSWLVKTCERAGRNLTSDEWVQYFPGEGHRKTCDQWPLEPEGESTPSSTP
ncbi:MAG: hypothetical protein L0287_34115, partial [Anaerolineae bacterium]|nr:hypothetical protein [Anaerolineae bacterium]